MGSRCDPAVAQDQRATPCQKIALPSNDHEYSAMAPQVLAYDLMTRPPIRSDYAPVHARLILG